MSCYGRSGSQNDAIAQAGNAARDEIFKSTEREKERMRQETAAYRVGATSDKFASTSQSGESQLAQRTVGLVSKEDFARIRQELEGEAAPPAAAPAAAEPKKKKKKDKRKAGALSFDMDDEPAEDSPAPKAAKADEAAEEPAPAPKAAKADEAPAPAAAPASAEAAPPD